MHYSRILHDACRRALLNSGKRRGNQVRAQPQFLLKKALTLVSPALNAKFPNFSSKLFSKHFVLQQDVQQQDITHMSFSHSALCCEWEIAFNACSALFNQHFISVVTPGWARYPPKRTLNLVFTVQIYNQNWQNNIFPEMTFSVIFLTYSISLTNFDSMTWKFQVKWSPWETCMCICMLREFCLWHRHCTILMYLCTIWTALYSNDGCWTWHDFVH